MKSIAQILLIGILGIGAFSAYASPDEGRAEKRLGRITQKLNLNEQQQQQFREVMKSHMEKRKAMREERISKINAILTTEQKEKFDQIREERKARRKERREKRKDCRKDLKGL